MKRKFIISMLMVCLLIVSSGCSNNNEKKDDKKMSEVQKKKDEEKKKVEEKKKEEQNVVDHSEQNGTTTPNQEINQDPVVDEDTTEVTLYIGYSGGVDNYKTVQARVTKPVTDEKLIAALAEEGNWDLTLANPIMPDNGGRVIEFSQDSTFTSGPDGTIGAKNEQKREYFCYDGFTLAKLILGSIQQTLDVNLMSPGRSLALYFSVVGEPIRVENKEIPVNKPWYEIYDTWDD